MINGAFEHIGINVADRDAVVGWYVENVGLTVVRDVPGKMAFLADSRGIVMLEVYSNPKVERLAFEETGALALHIAFEADDPEAAARELVEAGATVVDAYKTAGEDSLVMLRDPFGIPIQLIKRGARMQKATSFGGSSRTQDLE